jgi:glutamate-1-semialdehyde 2,1-aminomutase
VLATADIMRSVITEWRKSERISPMASHQAPASDIQAVGLERIRQRYVAKHPGSEAHHERALRRLPDGITHDSRYVDPFNLCITHAEGAYKWDCDGNRFVDLVTGHGALLLGHAHPALVEAVTEQITRGTHVGGNHALELDWADRICDIVPGAESVRFTASGTEAVMLAIRLARNFTDRQRIVVFQDHFHGWSDSAMAHAPGSPEVLQSVTTTLPCGDIELVHNALSTSSVAAVIIETSHPTFFTLDDPAGFLRDLRAVSQRVGTLLIVDEVVSGFRWAPGGAQEFYGAHGDLTALAKILAGGLPGGAVAGRRDVLNQISFNPEDRGGREKVRHPGTYNANPLASAAGIACLTIVKNPEIQRQATAAASAIRTGMNTVLRDAEVPGCVYGEASMFRIALGGEHLPPPADMLQPLPDAPGGRGATTGPLGTALNLEMANRGVALHASRGITSIAHSGEDIEFIVDAFAGTIAELKAVGLVGR